MKAKKERLYEDVDFLTSIRPYRNYKNLESLKRAAEYIEKKFERSGLAVFRQAWAVEGTPYENIVASYKPERKRRFIVGAHYDVYKEQPGADDNASGVAGLLETARLLAENNLNIDYGIDFVAYCLEEPPFFRSGKMGSYIHARSIRDDKQAVIGMISFEMIGYFTGNVTENESSASPFIALSGIRKYDDFNKKVSKLMKRNPNISTRRISFADDYSNAGPSDHRNYWEFGYPAVMVIGASEKGNPNYHKASDTIDTLDFEKLAEVVNSCTHPIFCFDE